MLSVYTGSHTEKLLEVLHFQGQLKTRPATGHEVIVKTLFMCFGFRSSFLVIYPIDFWLEVMIFFFPGGQIFDQMHDFQNDLLAGWLVCVA